VFFLAELKKIKLFRITPFKAVNTTLLYILISSYFLGITILLIYHRNWLKIDQFIFLAFILALFLGRAHLFLRDWLPFLLLFLSYEYLRGLVPLIANNVFITPMIVADLYIFGEIPIHVLQRWLFKANEVSWYDYCLVFIYFTHFIVPPLVAFIFWLKDRQLFRNFVFHLLVLSYAGFLTYLFFPAMPPWLASELGYIKPVYKIIHYVFNALDSKWTYFSIYEKMNPNAVAAIPSLHAAYPILILFYVGNIDKRLIPIFSTYCLIVWFSLVYLGEHYFIDLLVGLLYAVFFYKAISPGTSCFLKRYFRNGLLRNPKR
jgi:hypothetical protein